MLGKAIATALPCRIHYRIITAHDLNGFFRINKLLTRKGQGQYCSMWYFTDPKLQWISKYIQTNVFMEFNSESHELSCSCTSNDCPNAFLSFYS